jgi:hypothetical protein
VESLSEVRDIEAIEEKENAERRQPQTDSRLSALSRS